MSIYIAFKTLITIFVLLLVQAKVLKLFLNSIVFIRLDIILRRINAI